MADFSRRFISSRSTLRSPSKCQSIDYYTSIFQRPETAMNVRVDKLVEVESIERHAFPSFEAETNKCLLTVNSIWMEHYSRSMKHSITIPVANRDTCGHEPVHTLVHFKTMFDTIEKRYIYYYKRQNYSIRVLNSELSGQLSTTCKFMLKGACFNMLQEWTAADYELL